MCCSNLVINVTSLRYTLLTVFVCNEKHNGFKGSTKIYQVKKLRSKTIHIQKFLDFFPYYLSSYSQKKTNGKFRSNSNIEMS